MRRLSGLVFGTVIGLGLLAVQSVDATQINFGVTTGAKIEFVGSGDTFRMCNNNSGLGCTDTGAGGASRDFSITTIDGGGFTSLPGLLGNITGTFTIGAITTSGSVQTAAVTGAGVFSIDDGFGFSFTAALNWVDIQTLGTGGTINALGTVNLSGFSYLGANTDLLALAAFPSGIVVSTFSFIPAKNLTALTADGTTTSTSYSGSLTPVPEPATMFLGGVGLIAFAYAARRRLFG